MAQKIKKIAYITTGLHADGVGMVLQDTVTGIDRTAFEPVVISVEPRAELSDLLEKKGVRVIHLDADLKGYRKYNIFILIRLIFLLVAERPALIQTQIFYADAIGRIAGWLLHIPVVTVIHTTELDSKLEERFLRASRWMVSGWIASAKAAQTAAEEQKLIAREKTTLISNGVSASIFDLPDRELCRTKLGFSSDKKIILCVARLEMQKGIPFLIDAFTGVVQAHPAAHLVIVGGGSLYEALKQQIADRNLAAHIELRGTVVGVKEYLAASDYFVLPSLWEGLSIALLEAADAGLPLIASDVGGPSEIIVNNVTGFLVPAKDSTALMEKMKYVLGLPSEKLLDITRASQKRIREGYLVDTMVQKYEAYYRNCLRRR